MNYDALHVILGVGVCTVFLVMLFATRGGQQ